VKFRLAGDFIGSGPLKNRIGSFAVLCEKLCIFPAVNFVTAGKTQGFSQRPKSGLEILKVSLAFYFFERAIDYKIITGVALMVTVMLTIVWK